MADEQSPRTADESREGIASRCAEREEKNVIIKHTRTPERGAGRARPTLGDIQQPSDEGEEPFDTGDL